MRVNEIAAAIHHHMCTCAKHGYTQGSGRWGQGAAACSVVVDGKTYNIPGGDFDCSSSVIVAWQLALQYTEYAGCLGWLNTDRNGNYISWYTGNERWGFTSTGLFEWKPMSFLAETGDLYLNEKQHVSMCQSQNPDIVSEFLSNEFGDITGGRMGDQTGGESIVHGFWNCNYNGILHYNGKADKEDFDMTPAEMDLFAEKIGKATAAELASYAFGDDKKPNWNGYGEPQKNGGVVKNNYNVMRSLLSAANDIRAKLDILIKKA